MRYDANRMVGRRPTAAQSGRHSFGGSGDGAARFRGSGGVCRLVPKSFTIVCMLY